MAWKAVRLLRIQRRISAPLSSHRLFPALRLCAVPPVRMRFAAREGLWVDNGKKAGAATPALAIVAVVASLET